jgi:hypothetical protein
MPPTIHLMAEGDEFTWRDYEDYIYEKLKSWAGDEAIVEFDKKIKGKFSEVDRQVDVLISGRFANATSRNMTAAVDCKFYTREIDVKKVDEFIGFCQDLQTDIGILVTNKGFTPAAKRRADKGIDLQVIVAEIDHLPPAYHAAWDEGYFESDYLEGIRGGSDMAVIRYCYIDPQALQYSFDPDNPPEQFDDVVLSGPVDEIYWGDDDARAKCMRAILRFRRDGSEPSSEEVKAAVLELAQHWEDGQTWVLYDGQLSEWGA